MTSVFVFPVLILTGLLATVPTVEAGPAAYVLSNNSLIAIDTANPGSALSVTAVTGLNAGDSLVAIDFRPQNGFLYGLGFNSVAGSVQLYHVSHRTGVATAIGVPIASVAGTSFGFDFNATVDRIRVVTDAGQNFRINPNTGGLVALDTAINGATATVDAAAYTNNEQNATVATLYTLSAATNQLFIQNPPNSGTQTVPVGVTLNGAPLAFTAANGFDILPGVDVGANNAVATGVGFAALTVGGTTGLYTIDLTTGAASFIGPIGDGSLPVQGLALQGEAVPGGIPAIALTASGGQLLRFNTAAPGTTIAATVTGVVPGEVLAGIDWRPQTGQLFALGVDDIANHATLYRLDPQTGVATAIGAPGSIAFAGVAFPPAATGYGFDFNPTVDRIRVVTSAGQNFRVNPNTGGPIGPDTGINNPLPPGSTGVTGAAHTNSFGGAVVTTLYVLDPTSNMLFIQNPPNSGTLTAGLPVTLDGVPLDLSFVNGFDISGTVQVSVSNTPATGPAYAVLTVGGSTDLYTIELSTGAATLIGAIAGGASGLAGLAVGEPGVTIPPPPPPTVTLAVLKAGSGSGTVTSAPAGIDCGAICAADFLVNSTVTLTGTPAPGSVLRELTGGGCSGAEPCPVSMTAPTTVTATFAGDLVNVAVNRPQFTAGTTLRVAVSVNNPTGLPAIASFFTGAVLPDGDTVVFVTGSGVAFGRLSDPTTYQPIAAGVPLAAPLVLTVPDLLVYPWTGGEPHGTYRFFLAALDAVTGNLLGVSTATAVLGP